MNTIHLCTECGDNTDNPNSTSMCYNCQIRLLLNLLDDCENQGEYSINKYYCYHCDTELERTEANSHTIYYFCVKCNNFRSVYYTEDEKDIIKDLRYTLPSGLFYIIPSLIFIFRKYMKNTT